MDIAKGEFITFLDSDDFYFSYSIQKAVDAFDNNTDIVIFTVNPLYEINEAQRYLAPTEHYFQNPYSGKFDLTEKIIFNIPETVTNKMFRRKFIEENKLRFPLGLIHEDVAFHLMTMFCVNKSVTFIPERLYTYRIRMNSIATQSKLQPKTAHKLANLLFVKEFFKNRNQIKKIINPEFLKFLNEKFNIEFNNCGKNIKKKR